MQITWLDALRRKRASYTSPLADADTHPLGTNEERALNPQVRSREAEWAFIASRDTRQPVYSRPFKDTFGTAVFQTHVPLLDGGVFAGALIVEYSIEGLLRYFVPPEVSAAPRDVGARRRRPRAGQHGDRAARPRQPAGADRPRRAVRAVGQRPGAARRGLPHLGRA